MLRIAKTEARRRFSEVITRAAHKGERVKITHYGRTLAVIVPTTDLRTLERQEKQQQLQVEEPDPRSSAPRRGGRRRAIDPGR
jgi:prevent-host-death family protein